MSFNTQNSSFYNEVLDKGHLWQDGWYLYSHSQGEVSGPFLANDVFGSKGNITDKALVSVSRRGLSRWYDFAALEELFDSREVKSNVAETHPKKRSQARLTVTKKVIARPSDLNLGAKNSEHQAIQLIKPVLAEKSSPKVKLNEKSAKPAQVKTSVVRRQPSQKEIEYRHLTMRGRLRLGSFQSPFYEAFVRFVYSCGYSWKTWFEQATIECSYHVDDPQGLEKLKNLWHVFVPGVHLLKVYRLARLVMQMEIQNHYKRTSPTLAFLFALFPPFAIYYLQRAMNAHWALHVSHARPVEQDPSKA